MKTNLIPKVVSDDGKRKVIRYSLPKGAKNFSRGTTPDPKKVHFINHDQFAPVNGQVRVEGVKSSFAPTEYREQIVRASAAPIQGKASYTAPKVRKVSVEPRKIVATNNVQRNPQGNFLKFEHFCLFFYVE